MSRKRICCDCGRALKRDEIALTQKLIDIDTEEFYCLDCLAEYIKEKIQEFKEQGCTVFL